MAGINSYAVIQFLASATEPHTQKTISEATGVPQASVSRVLREAPGIIANTNVRPTLYSFDSTTIIQPEVKENYTGVTRPDGSILLEGRWYVPQTDTLAEVPWPDMAKRIDSFVIEITRKGSVETLNKKSLTNMARIFGEISYTLNSRMAKGDFDGTSD